MKGAYPSRKTLDDLILWHRWLVFVHSSVGAESILCVFTTLETRRRTTTIYGNQRLAYRSVGSRDGCVLVGCRVMVMRSEKTTNLVLQSIDELECMETP